MEREGVQDKIAAIKHADRSYTVDSRGTAPNGTQTRLQVRTIAKQVRRLYPADESQSEQSNLDGQ